MQQKKKKIKKKAKFLKDMYVERERERASQLERVQNILKVNK